MVPETVPPATWASAGTEKQIPNIKSTAVVQQNK
jgi:hypothetical protein